MTYIVKNCCGLFSLKKGTIIIGVLQAILGFCLMVNEGRYAMKSRVHNRHKYANLAPPIDYATEDKIFHIILAISGGINMILSFLLIHGARKESPRLMKPWLALMTCVTIFTILIFCFYVIETTTEEGFRLYLLYSFSSLVFVIPSMALTAYCILVVSSFHQELSDPADRCCTETTCIARHVSESE